MAYATTTQWGDRYGHLDDNLASGQIATMLEEASRAADNYMGRRSMEPKRVVTRWEHLSARTDAVWLPDYPPRYAESWFCRLMSLKVYRNDGLLRWNVGSPDTTCRKWVEQSGLIVLPSNITVESGDVIEADYFCGYGTINQSNVMTASIPVSLVSATLEWTKALVFTALGQRGEFEAISEAGVAKSKAQEMLAQWRRLAVSGSGLG